MRMKSNRVFATKCDFLTPIYLQTMNCVKSNNLRLKYQRFTASGCSDIMIRKFEFVATKKREIMLWISHLTE